MIYNLFRVEFLGCLLFRYGSVLYDKPMIYSLHSVLKKKKNIYRYAFISTSGVYAPVNILTKQSGLQGIF